MDPCLTPRPRRGSNGNRRPGAARHEMHSSTTRPAVRRHRPAPARRRRRSVPAPQLLAAATAPATAAELQGESAARAAFRSSMHSAPLPDDLPRRPPVRVTTSIMIAKAIAAIALTASTAGGIALATTSTPADPHARPASESAATGDARPPPWCSPPRRRAELRSPTLTNGARCRRHAGSPPVGASGSAGDAAARRDTRGEGPAPDRAGAALRRTSPSDGHPAQGRPDTPAFADLSCTEAAAGADATEGRPLPPAGRPAAPTSAPPATPSTGPASPTTPATPTTVPRARARPTEPRRPGRTTTPPTLRPTPTPAAAAGTADRGKSGGHHQPG